MVRSVKAAATRSATTATVSVEVAIKGVLPGWHATVTQSASMPVERITKR
jgi:hypothetical protein